MDEIRPLLGNQLQQGSELQSPNLSPRHNELIRTLCGPVKRWSDLSSGQKLYFCFTIVSLLALLGLTVNSICKQSNDTEVYDEDNFTVSLIQMVGLVFCIYYISRGVLQENRQEMAMFVLNMLVVMVRSVANFSVQEAKAKQELLARFVFTMCLGIVHVFCTILLILKPNWMAFHVSGALESLQKLYFLHNLCFSMVILDLQAQLCLCIMITTSDFAMSTVNSVILGVGVVWACLTTAVGTTAVLRESKVLVWIFTAQNLPQLGLFVYLLHELKEWFHDNTYTLEAASVIAALISLLIKVVLFCSLLKLACSFGQGLRERIFPSGSQ